MGTKLIIAVIVVGLCIIVGSSVFIVSFFYDNFIVFERFYYQTGNPYPIATPHATFYAGSPVPILNQPTPLIQTAANPTLLRLV